MKPWTFLFATDIHIGSPRSYRYAPSWTENWKTAKKQMEAIPADFLLVGGDLTRDGSIHRFELEGAEAELDSLPFPYHVVPGNMDTGNKHTEVMYRAGANQADNVSLNMTSEQLAQFESVFGPSQWSFVHKNVRFSGFCDMLAGSGLPEEKSFWEWMEAQKEQPRAQFHVWMMHSPLFLRDLHEPNYDITVPDQYRDWYFNIDEPHRSRIMDVFRATGATVVCCGHLHLRMVRYAEEIRFDLGPSTAVNQFSERWPEADPTLGFLRYDVTDREIRCSFIPLERFSTAKGYGPGGHPAPEARDYSIAWEKVR